MTANVLFGCAGPDLEPAEREFFRDADPLGFILFARNCETPDQVRRLVDALREAIGNGEAPVLIDQEGGRVARLGPPHWRKPPAAQVFARLARLDPAGAQEAAWLNARLIATDLAALGITVDCAPVLDLPQPGAHAIIGDRALGDDPAVIADLGRAVCDGLLAGGVLPVIKHIPGHGRAGADSHVALPVVVATKRELEVTDFKPFAALADMPWAMTAHVVYSALDKDHPATTSSWVINKIIRGRIGFGGVLVSDDLSMEALSGSLAARTRAAIDAGCDLVLHCNGKRAEMEAVMTEAGALAGESLARVAGAEALRAVLARPFDRAAGAARLMELLG